MHEEFEEERAKINLQIVLATLMTAAVLIIPITSLHADYNGKYYDYKALLEKAISDDMSEEYIDSLRNIKEIYLKKTGSTQLSLLSIVIATFSSLLGILLFIDEKTKLSGRELTGFVTFIVVILVLSILFLVSAIFNAEIAFGSFIITIIIGSITIRMIRRKQVKKILTY